MPQISSVCAGKTVRFQYEIRLNILLLVPPDSLPPPSLRVSSIHTLTGVNDHVRLTCQKHILKSTLQPHSILNLYKYFTLLLLKCCDLDSLGGIYIHQCGKSVLTQKIRMQQSFVTQVVIPRHFCQEKPFNGMRKSSQKNSQKTLL